MFKLFALLVVLAVVAAQAPPPFLQGATPEVVGQFNQLLRNIAGKPEAQFDADVRAFIAKQSPQVQASFAAFETQKRAQSAGAHKP